MNSYKDATIEEVDKALKVSWEAFQIYRKKSLKERSDFLRSIGDELKKNSDPLIELAHRETHLEKSRLKLELNRTIFQLTSYGEACAEGTWMDIRIDTGNADRNTPKPDLRKMLVPLGPVVVFGSSNFPFAYSTAGGDTACALAAGCPVVLKAHPAHAGTSEMVAEAVQKAAQTHGLPPGVFIHLHGSGFEVGQALVQHPLVRAVGFTGSFQGGKALFDLASKRKLPIPVFAEMGSVNPVFLLPEKLKKDKEKIAEMYASSITQGNGQFCTNPGLMVGIEDETLEHFLQLLGNAISQAKPARMLHAGIAKSFREKRKLVLESEGVGIVSETVSEAGPEESIPTIARVPAERFLENSHLHQEVFGPFSLMIVCRDKHEMLEVARSMEGQLTTTVMATTEELNDHQDLLQALQDLCGRFILNGVPTGVEVALAMHHGGPYPATTDSRFTAVGADGIRRFARPICFQNWEGELLPEELMNENPLGIWRTVNNVLTNEKI